MSVGVRKLREDVPQLVHQLSRAQSGQKRFQRSDPQARLLLAGIAARKSRQDPEIL